MSKARWFVVALLCSGAVAFAQAPSLNSARQAAAPGGSTEVFLFGDNLKNASTLWTSFKASTEAVVTNEAQKTVWRLKVPGTVAVGVHAVRLGSAAGVSSPLLFLMDDLPSITANGSNHTTATAQVITVPTAIDGACESFKSDFYRFKAAKNQRVAIEVVAQRLNSALDPVIRLYDANARELAFNEDAPGLGEDARLVYRFAAAGEYLVEVRDTKYEGGTSHRYHLRLGDFPLLSTTYPLAVQTKATASIEFAGPDATGLKPIAFVAPTEPGSVALSAKMPKGVASGFSAVVVSIAKETLEQEPNDTAATAQAVALPLALSGRFASATDHDWFAFEAKKGQRVVLTVKTRSFGSPSEAYLRLCQNDGSTIAEADVTGADETSLTNTFKADGTYKVLVEELTRRGGPEHTYHLEIAVREAGFSITSEIERVQIAPGGTGEIKVTAARRDYDGPITLEVVGLPDGFKVESNVLEEKKNETTLKLTVPSGLAPGTVQTFRIKGTAKVNEKEFAAFASNQTALRKALPNLRVLPPALDGVFALGVKAKE